MSSFEQTFSTHNTKSGEALFKAIVANNSSTTTFLLTPCQKENIKLGSSNYIICNLHVRPWSCKVRIFSSSWEDSNYKIATQIFPQFLLLGNQSNVLLWHWTLAQRVLTLTLGVVTYLLLQWPTCPQIFNPNNATQIGVLKNWTLHECMLSLPNDCMKFLFSKLFVTIFCLG
jgi:hypothetical protein